MAQTTHYDFDLPNPGGDDNAWGNFLNGNWSALDTILKSLQDQITQAAAQGKIGVNGLYLSTSATNPSTTLGYGTWAAYAAGRALVGVGSNGEATWTAGQTKGSETHTLTTAQIPAHNHSVDPPSATTSSNGTHTHDDAVGDIYVSRSSGFGIDLNGASKADRVSGVTALQAAGAHTHSLNIPAFNSANAGGGGSHNNVQPSIAVYVWRRTA